MAMGRKESTARELSFWVFNGFHVSDLPKWMIFRGHSFTDNHIGADEGG